MIQAVPLTAEAFRPFGDVIETGGRFLNINDDRCQRFHNLAGIDIVEGTAGISLFRSDIRPVPLMLELLERHPSGSQAFLPMEGSEYLAIVAPDANGVPGPPVAFHARAHQGVNYARNTWHGVLAPISGSGLFAVIDRIGAGPNLEEHWLAVPLSVFV